MEKKVLAQERKSQGKWTGSKEKKTRNKKERNRPIRNTQKRRQKKRKSNSTKDMNGQPRLLTPIHFYSSQTCPFSSTPFLSSSSLTSLSSTPLMQSGSSHLPFSSLYLHLFPALPLINPSFTIYYPLYLLSSSPVPLLRFSTPFSLLSTTLIPFLPPFHFHLSPFTP